jgi:hypothetical protein
MDDPSPVSRVKRICNLRGDREGLVHSDRATRDPFRKRLSMDELHYESTEPVGGFEAMDCCDVRMIQRRDRLRFALKSRETFGMGGKELWQDFQRDVVLRSAVTRSIDLADGSGADERDDFVRSDA